MQLIGDMYGVAGPEVLCRQLDLLLAGHDWLWAAVGFGARNLLERKTPYQHEPDLVERIAYRELNYGAEPDGLPLDPAVALREMALGTSNSWPSPTISSPPCRDSTGRPRCSPAAATSPRPGIAQRVVELVPDAVLVDLPTAGHSMLDTREHAALQVCRAAAKGQIAELGSRGNELDKLPANLTVRLMVAAIRVAARAESTVPDGAAGGPTGHYFMKPIAL